MDNSSRSEADLALEARVLTPWARRFIEKYSLDPITIAIIIQAIVAVLRLINDCRKQKTWPASYKLRKNPALKRLMKYTIIAEVGLRNYFKFGDKLVEEMIGEDINEVHSVLAALPHLSSE